MNLPGLTLIFLNLRNGIGNLEIIGRSHYNGYTPTAQVSTAHVSTAQVTAAHVSSAHVRQLPRSINSPCLNYPGENCAGTLLIKKGQRTEAIKIVGFGTRIDKSSPSHSHRYGISEKDSTPKLAIFLGSPWARRVSN